jgi:hypothetical protein
MTEIAQPASKSFGRLRRRRSRWQRGTCACSPGTRLPGARRAGAKPSRPQTHKRRHVGWRLGRGTAAEMSLWCFCRPLGKNLSLSTNTGSRLRWWGTKDKEVGAPPDSNKSIFQQRALLIRASHALVARGLLGHQRTIQCRPGSCPANALAASQSRSSPAAGPGRDREPGVVDGRLKGSEPTRKKRQQHSVRP